MKRESPTRDDGDSQGESRHDIGSASGSGQHEDPPDANAPCPCNPSPPATRPTPLLSSGRRRISPHPAPRPLPAAAQPSVLRFCTQPGHALSACLVACRPKSDSRCRLVRLFIPCPPVTIACYLRHQLACRSCRVGNAPVVAWRLRVTPDQSFSSYWLSLVPHVCAAGAPAGLHFAFRYLAWDSLSSGASLWIIRLPTDIEAITARPPSARKMNPLSLHPTNSSTFIRNVRSLPPACFHSAFNPCLDSRSAFDIKYSRFLPGV